MSNSQASPLNESLFTFDYNSLQQEIENTMNADYIDDEYFDGAFDEHGDLEMDDESESGFDREVPLAAEIELTPCVIIDNENDSGKVDCCNNVNRNRSIHNLIGSFEIDSNAVKEVEDKIERLGKRQTSCVDKNEHERDSKSSLELIAKWINNVALSNDNDEKNELLNLLTKVIKDFKPESSTVSTETDSTSISTEFSDNQTTPSFFLLNVAFAVKKLNLNEYQEINQLNPETFKNYGKTLAISIWQSRNIFQENKSSLESPESLDEFHESIPENLTNFFNGLFSTLQHKKLEH
ncbi:5556_t:CDS:2 [Entrophospora sp. SA101]|nr:5556_t:CDS:2 [Entrophospora sp. SA101]